MSVYKANCLFTKNFLNFNKFYFSEKPDSHGIPNGNNQKVFKWVLIELYLKNTRIL